MAVQSFSPILGAHSEILILGTMPSQRSIQEQRYYAHPQNSFWWIMSQLLGFPEKLSYVEQCDHLKQSKYALWDVLYDCQREGSLDKSIQRNTEEVNDFDKLFNEHHTLKKIAFNGIAAKKIFMRHCKKTLLTKDYLKTIQLPSTSPAHASLSRHEKLTQWYDGLQLK